MMCTGHRVPQSFWAALVVSARTRPPVHQSTLSPGASYEYASSDHQLYCAWCHVCTCLGGMDSEFRLLSNQTIWRTHDLDVIAMICVLSGGDSYDSYSVPVSRIDLSRIEIEDSDWDFRN
ncbi:hypothetical protein BJX99DRAFT_220084 [Aspergillus californicus]